MRRTIFLPSLVFLSISFWFTFAVLAQSGRGRQPATPPPKPTPRPSTPGGTTRPPAGATTILNLPEGGRMLRQDIEGPTTRYVLRNGLTILIRERHSIPLAAATVFIKAGSIQESDDQAGVAQLTSTWMRAGKDITGTMAKLGARFSSEVDYDNATLRMAAPAESLERALQMFAEMVINPTFPAAEMTKVQRETVRTAKRFQDQVEEMSLDRLYATAFTSHRIRRGRYASEARISALTREQVVAFHQAHYQPQNTVIAISGDVFPLRRLARFSSLSESGSKAGTAPVIGLKIRFKTVSGTAMREVIFHRLSSPSDIELQLGQLKARRSKCWLQCSLRAADRDWPRCSRMVRGLPSRNATKATLPGLSLTLPQAISGFRARHC